MPSRQMGMCIGARHARERVCASGLHGRSRLLPRDAERAVCTDFWKLGCVITIPVWPCINNENAKIAFKAILSELLAF